MFHHPAQLIEAILAAESNLVAVRLPVVEELLEPFQRAARRTGLSVYQWSEDEGLRSLRESDVQVPGSRRLTDALRYISQSMHFGVYLFQGWERQLRGPNVALLRQIAKLREGHSRKVVLLANDVRITAALSEVAEHFQFTPGGDTRLRLRDGRWIQS